MRLLPCDDDPGQRDRNLRAERRDRRVVHGRLRQLNHRRRRGLGQPDRRGGALGTVQVTNNTAGVQIGATGKGFTVIGIDNGLPGIENFAVWFQGSHSGAQVIDDEIVANGDAALMTEFGAMICGFIIDNNEFSGQTFAGEPRTRRAGKLMRGRRVVVRYFTASDSLALPRAARLSIPRAANRHRGVREGSYRFLPRRAWSRRPARR